MVPATAQRTVTRWPACGARYVQAQSHVHGAPGSPTNTSATHARPASAHAPTSSNVPADCAHGSNTLAPLGAGHSSHEAGSVGAGTVHASMGVCSDTSGVSRTATGAFPTLAG